MPLCTADFELGVDGAAITPSDPGSNTRWDKYWGTAGGSSTKYDSAHGIHGLLAGKYDSGPSSGVEYMQWEQSHGSMADSYGRFYMYLPSIPTSYLAVCVLENALGQVHAAFRIESTGKLAVCNQNAAVATSTTTLATGQTIRIEYRMLCSTTGAGIIEALLFNSDPEALTPDETVTASAQTTLSATSTKADFGRVLQGGPQNNYAHWMDDIIAGAMAYPGPIASRAMDYVPTRQELVGSKIGPF